MVMLSWDPMPRRFGCANPVCLINIYGSDRSALVGLPEQALGIWMDSVDDRFRGSGSAGSELYLHTSQSTFMAFRAVVTKRFSQSWLGIDLVYCAHHSFRRVSIAAQF